MASNFFEQQDQSRANSKKLLFYFVLAVIGIIASTYLVCMAAFYFANLENMEHSFFSWAYLWQPGIAFLITIGTICIVSLGSIYKIYNLQGGGKVVAESLGGRRLHYEQADFVEKRLINVVQEMALASGIQAPPVYLLDDEDGINAFAAGYSPDDAIIGVTRGAAERLDRSELQGVIAHEFSHIMNGDMRLNIRLMGIIHGILVLGLIGYYVLRSAGHGGSRKKSGAALLFIGLGLMIIGYVGSFFGNLIKAALNRQREYLADASAVQFTRNPDGIAGALMTIGGYDRSANVEHDHADEASHMFFGQAITGFRALFATHPPLQDRITRIKPEWEGNFSDADKIPEEQMKEEANIGKAAGASGFAGEQSASSTSSHEQTSTADTSKHVAQSEASKSLGSEQVSYIGNPGQEHLAQAQQLLKKLPEPLRKAVHDPYDVRAVVLALLMNQHDRSIDEQILKCIAKEENKKLAQRTDNFRETISEFGSRFHLPLLEMSLSELRSMSDEQTRDFVKLVKTIIKADQKITIFEWCLYTILRHALRSTSEQRKRQQVQFQSLRPVSADCRLLLSYLAHVGHQDEQELRKAYKQAIHELPISASILSPEDCSLSDLKQSMERLGSLSGEKKQEIIEACIDCVSSDGQVTVKEGELMRAVCAILQCPMPPLLPE